MKLYLRFSSNMSRAKIFLVFFLSSFYTGNSQNFTDLEIEKKEKEIELSYRWLIFKDQSKVREMKAEYFINANIPVIIDQFQNSQKLKNWQISEESNIKMLGLKTWQTYLKFKLPWPFKSMDLITINKIVDKDDFLIIISESSPTSHPVKDNVSRIQSLRSHWKLIPSGIAKTKIIYTSISHDKPEFPRIIADPLIQDRLIKTLVLLKENAEDENTNSKD